MNTLEELIVSFSNLEIFKKAKFAFYIPILKNLFSA